MLNSFIPFSTSFSCTDTSSLRLDTNDVRCGNECLFVGSVGFFIGNGSGLSASTLGKKLIVAFSLMKLSALRLSSSSALPGSPTKPLEVMFPMLLLRLVMDVVLPSLYDEELLLSHNPITDC